MTNELTDKDVAAYLADNPDFFLNHDSLLVKLKLADNRDGTISLVEKQLSVMRERQKKTRRQLKDAIEAAEKNNEIFDKCQRLILQLMAAGDSNSFFSALEKSLKKDFKCKAYALIIFGTPRSINHFTEQDLKEHASAHVGALIKAKEPTLGILRPEELDYLFGEQSKKVKSAAVLTVRQHNKQIALLAIGSSDAHYFSPNMGTLFLRFIADTLATLLPRHLPD